MLIGMLRKIDQMMHRYLLGNERDFRISNSKISQTLFILILFTGIKSKKRRTSLHKSCHHISVQYKKTRIIVKSFDLVEIGMTEKENGITFRRCKLGNRAFFELKLRRDTWYGHLLFLPKYYENVSDETFQRHCLPTINFKTIRDLTISHCWAAGPGREFERREETDLGLFNEFR
jgi:hypothetical protein